jgi:hypothetical protein
VYDLPDATGVTSMVAGMSAPWNPNSKAAGPVPVLKVFYVKASSPDKLTVAVETTAPSVGGAPSFTTVTDTVPVAWHKDAGPLQIALNYDNSVLVTAMVNATFAVTPKNDARMYYYTDAYTVDHTSGPAQTSWGYWTGFEYLPLARGSGWSAIVTGSWGDSYTPMIHLYLPGTSQQAKGGIGPGVMVLFAPLHSGLSADTVPKDKTANNPTGFPDSATNPQTEVAAVAFVTALGAQLMPTALVWTRSRYGQNVDQRLWALSSDLLHGSAWHWTELVLPGGTLTGLDLPPVSTALTPSPDTATAADLGAKNLLDVFVLAGDMLCVFRQAASGDAVKNAAQPVYCPAIPLQPGVAAMTSQIGVSDGNELLLAGTDGMLQSLEKDPVSGRWTDTVVHVPAIELQQVSSYRITLTLADLAWNAAVTGQQVSITASTPAMAMIEGPSPQAVALGPDPVTVNTDGSGQVSIALLADGLSAPTLMLSTDGVPDPVTVYPSGPVNTYLRGQDGTTLNYLPTMSPATLAAAKTPDGQTVAPGAAKPADAADAFTTMSQAATLGAQGAQNGLVSTTVARLDAARPRAGGKPGKPGHRTGVSVKAQTSSIDHWAHDVLHAIKKGAVAVSKITIVAEAFTLVTDLMHWTENAVTVVVHGIEDAAHVLHAAFAKLGAAIVHAVKWLEAETIGLLRDSAKVAAEFATLITQCTSYVGDQAAASKKFVDTWLLKEQGAVKQRFDTIRAGYAKGTTLGNIADNKPAQLSAAQRRLRLRPLPKAKPASRAAAAADDTQSQPHGNWFFNKIKHDVFGELDVAGIDGFDQIRADLRSGFQGGIADFEKACMSFWEFLKVSITHPSEFDTVGVPALLAAVSDLLDGALILARGVIDALFDLIAELSKIIGGMLNTPLSQMGIAGKLLKLAGLGDIHIGSVVTMLLAFPATLAFKIAHGGDTRPFAQLPALRAGVGTGDDKAAKDLRFTASAVMGTWASLNVIGAFFDKPPMFFAALEVAGPLLVGALAPPSVDENGFPAWDTFTTDEMTPRHVSWFTDILPAFLHAWNIYTQHQAHAGHVTAADAEDQEQMTLWYQALLGVFSLVAGVIGASEDPEAGGKDYALPILLNFINIPAFLKTATFQKASVGISTMTYIALDIGGALGGAILYNQDV